MGQPSCWRFLGVATSGFADLGPPLPRPGKPTQVIDNHPQASYKSCWKRSRKTVPFKSRDQTLSITLLQVADVDVRDDCQSFRCALPRDVCRETHGVLAGDRADCRAVAGLLPIPLSITAVFLFAGPHNWLEGEYFLTRMPARWGRLTAYFAVGLGGSCRVNRCVSHFVVELDVAGLVTSGGDDQSRGLAHLIDYLDRGSGGDAVTSESAT